MAIVTSKLVSAAMLQDFIIGKDAEPLAAGVVTMYQDSNHAILKNWYYQTGVAPNYTFAALPNPMTLSAAGTMQDVNGNDIIPFYYPWDETDSDIAQPYFVTVYNANGQLQFTRSGFPFVPNPSTPVVNEIPTFENYVINNRFWRNIGTLNSATLPNSWTTQYNNSGTIYYQTLCPGQHDGFSMPDINYIKNVNGSATETITFNTFAKQQTPVLKGDIQPEFYINHNCTADSSGASIKAYQFPISLHLATLSCQPFTFTIQGQLVSGATTIGIYIYTFCGTGVASPVRTLIGNITFNTTWTKWDVTGTFPSTLGLTLGSDGTGGNDDAYYLQIEMPSGSSAVCNLNFTLPSLYLSTATEVPTNSFATYDQIDSVVANPRTGDIKTSLNSFYPYGWVPLSDGTLAIPGNITPPTNTTVAYQGNDAWPLYNLLWTTFSSYVINGAELVQIYDSSGAPASFGASAYADWNALKQIQLTQMMGRVILGTVPASALTAKYKTTFTASNSSGQTLLTTGNAMNFFLGMPFYITTTGSVPSNMSVNTIYYAVPLSTSTLYVATSYANALQGTVLGVNSGAGSNCSIVLAFSGTNAGDYAQNEVIAATPTASSNLSIASNTGTVGQISISQKLSPATFMNMFIKL